MKERILALILAMFLLLSLGACGENKGNNTKLSWPTTGVGNLLPKPESETGEISSESEKLFSVDIAETSMDSFKKYVEDCKEKGFTVDYSGTTDSYVAKDNNGNSLSILYYADEEKMSIMVSVPNDEKKTNTETKETEEQTKKSSGVSPDFKEKLDTCEDFINDYVDFMKKYKNSDDVTSMMTDYADYMSKYADVISQLDSIEKEKDSLSAEDCAYFVKVDARITKKLAEVAQ